MADDARLDPAVERRATKRFRIELELKYRLLDRKAGARETGKGRTVNFSSRGVLFRAEASLRPGEPVEIATDWPALLSGTCPLKLVARGQVLRVENELIVVTIEQYEFHTRRTKEWLPEFLRRGP